MNAVHELLDAMRVSLGGCRLIAFVDLRAELVLSCSAEAKPPQEELDALAGWAVQALTSRNGSAIAGPGGGTPDEIVILSPEHSTLILRAENDVSEAICCVCETAQDIELLRVAARETLVKIAADELTQGKGE